MQEYGKGHEFVAEHDGKPMTLWVTSRDDWGLCTCENGEVYVHLYDVEIDKIETTDDKRIHTALTPGQIWWDEFKLGIPYRSRP